MRWASFTSLICAPSVAMVTAAASTSHCRLHFADLQRGIHRDGLPGLHLEIAFQFLETGSLDR